MFNLLDRSMNNQIRAQFPILSRVINGNQLIYFDNAATSQKPKVVIDAIVDYYTNNNANIHRSIHTLAGEATQLWLDAHETVARFINASSYEEIVFVRNSSEGLNLIINSLGRAILEKGDVVAISEMEHHSNIVPWQLLSKEKGFRIEWIPVTLEGYLELEYLDFLVRKYGDRLKFVSIVHQSNVMDSMVDFKSVKQKLKESNAITILDVSQSITHSKIDVRELKPDFLVFSGHKLYGPTGSGALYGRKDLLQQMNPWMGGGEMIRSVTKSGAEWNDLPWKFEAGTPNIEGGIGLMAALNWFEKNIDRKELQLHLNNLVNKTIDGVRQISGVSIIGPKNRSERNSLLSFHIKDIHAHDIVEIVNEKGIAIRGGYLCAQPIHDKFELGPSTRVSFAVYNTEEEVEKFLSVLESGIRKFK